MMKACLLFIMYGCTILEGLAQEKMWADEEETSEFWNNVAQEDIRERVSIQEEGFNRNVAKNVILFLGDGMGIPTVTAGRILKGQLQNKSGEETVLSFDTFPHTGTSRTYSVNKQTSDSACTATAYLCGVKTNNKMLGLNAKANQGNCASAAGNEVQSILIDAFEAGKSTGIVTTTRINHATPGASYAHTPSRSWYCDSDLPQEAVNNSCRDIAQQFIDESDKITVALGGGRMYFHPRFTTDEEYPNRIGRRGDNKNLIRQWQNGGESGEIRRYVWNLTEFENVDPIATDKLLGLFEPKDMQYAVDRHRDGAGEPSLDQMTKKAIQILRKNPNGYLLLVEGGRIDHGHHAGDAYSALHEFVDFEKAVQVAKDLTSESDTLVVVTADHSHTMSLGGYTYRGNPVFGLAPSPNSPQLATDSKPFTSILYGNGPGYQGADGGVNERANLTDIDTEHRQYRQQTGAYDPSESHGGEDVGIYASGPFAHLFHGVHEQNYIPHVFRYASCIGGVTEHCDGASSSVPTTSTKLPTTDGPAKVNFIGYQLSSADATVALYVNFVLVISLVFFAICLSVLSFMARRPKSTSINPHPDTPLSVHKNEKVSAF